ncbi:ATP-dependent RNA helicase TDRD9-like [Branchiostoma floridae]|uniref:ATP-dependent RNA helicase TDRD9 n=1 Tax=Branchiostoma floridae TaxID=7739 RepID=A0A9J7KTN0_BRAFL|nr:ATP-dependent RNA helicase TDRD9-like [Branchiostoma floridae]
MSGRLTSDLSIDYIDSWFSLDKPLVPLNSVPRSKLGGKDFDAATGGPAKPEAPMIPRYKKEPRMNNPRQTQYAQMYQQHELDMAQDDLESIDERMSDLNALDLDSINSLAGDLGRQTLEEDPLRSVNIYRNYNFNHTYNPTLPITGYQEEIITTVESNSVTVIQGDTGSGKTTQVPQYILDHYARANRWCNIVVTQPRRIAAISIARRVADERGWRLGGIVGYQVGMDKQQSEDTRLSFVTTGVLLQKLINTKNMNQFTHVILDEVHERDQETDFALLVARKLLRSNSRHVKVVLMSATLDSSMFAGYFSIPVRGELAPAPVVTVEGRLFPVTEFYVEDLAPLGPLPVLEWDCPEISQQSFELARKLILYFDQLEAQEQGRSISEGLGVNRGTVLVFLPGLAEINTLDELLAHEVTRYKLWVLPLHSTITSEEQAQVFVPPRPYQRKVILSTNIAESSITVPDIKYVIDFCLTKCMVCDPETNYQSLQLNWASQANCTQRKGRAGRVSSGRAYRMVSREFYDIHLPEYGIPEMQRCPLEQLVLKVKLLDLGEPKAILGLALQPPNLDAIEATVLLLKEVGALSTDTSEGINPHDGDLTFIGRVLAALPVDVRVGKLLLLGHVFGYLKEVLVIGASLSLKSFFAKPFRGDLESYRSKMAWSEGTFSDCLAMLNAYKKWQDCCQSGMFRNRQQELEWAKRNMLQLKRMKEMSAVAKELQDRLANFNIRVSLERNPLVNHSRDTSQDNLILKMVLAGAFYPNYFTCAASDEAEAVRDLSGSNPLTTVMLRGMPPAPQLYLKQLGAAMRPCGEGKFIKLEDTRAYVEFAPPPDYHGTGVLPAVYLAVKMRSMRIPLELRLRPREEVQRALLQQATAINDSKKLRTNRLYGELGEGGRPSVKVEQTKGPKAVEPPSPKEPWMQLYVTEVVECGHFWAHRAEAEYFDQLAILMETINQDGGANLEPLPANLVLRDQYCLAPYQDESTVKYYRARIVAAFPDHVKVFYLDYGNMETVLKSCLCRIPSELLEIPFQSMECYLKGIRPSFALSPEGKWDRQATLRFHELVADRILLGKVFSVVRGAIRLDLYRTTKQEEVFINHQLVRENLADLCEETYASKKSHQDRAEQSLAPEDSTHLWTPADSRVEHDVPEDNFGLRGRSMVRLNGPYSPYEMVFYSMINIGRLRSVRIERDSVNSVALNDRPQDTHQRMLVAGHVGVSTTGSTITARDTTLMPNMPGLAAIVCLLFTPVAELRTNRAHTHLTGAICGLGCDPETGIGILPDHDLEITFDTSFTRDDLIAVNKVRIAINLALGSENNIAEWGPSGIKRIQDAAKNKILTLIQRKRETVEPQMFHKPYWWNQVKPEDILDTGLDDTSANCRSLLSLHQGIAVVEDVEEGGAPKKENDDMWKRKHMMELREKAYNSNEPQLVRCEVCDVEVNTPRELKLHVATRKHRAEEVRLFGE